MSTNDSTLSEVLPACYQSCFKTVNRTGRVFESSIMGNVVHSCSRDEELSTETLYETSRPRMHHSKTLILHSSTFNLLRAFLSNGDGFKYQDFSLMCIRKKYLAVHLI